MEARDIKKLYYSISEVSEITDLKQYVLRYWETEFSQLKPTKNYAGNRCYKSTHIKSINEIKELLYNQKFTIKGARQHLIDNKQTSDVIKDININETTISLDSINKLKSHDIVISNRFLTPNLLQDWPLVRIWLTFVRHLAIRILLSIPYDSSGAFRCINCKKVSLSDLILAKDNGYSYFWESIFILHQKKYKINQVSVSLPFRQVGESKITFKDIFFGIYYLLLVFIKKVLGRYDF